MTGTADGIRQYADDLAASFGLGELLSAPIPAARGQQGMVWRFDTDTGSYAVKHLLVPTTRDAVAADVAFQEVMLRRADLLLPRPVRSPGGEPLLEVAGLPVRAYTWMDLLPPRVDLDPSRIGALFAAVHRDPIPAPGPVHPWYVDPIEEGGWRALGERLTRADAPFAPAFDEFARHHQDLQCLLLPPTGLQLCHRDLWMGNARPTPDGRICVIDWENFGAADPSQELAMPVYECCYDDPSRAAALYEAYLAGGGTGRLTDRGDFSMVIAQLGHFAVTAAERWLAAASEDERGRNEAWFREGHDQPLTVDLIDAFLAAIS